MNTEKLQEYAKKYMPFVLTILIVGLIFFFVLTGCKGDVETQEVSNPDYPQWEYNVVTARCELDRQNSVIVCKKINENDTSYLDNLMTQMGNQGWELESTENFENLTSFIFKRPKLVE